MGACADPLPWPGSRHGRARPDPCSLSMACIYLPTVHRSVGAPAAVAIPLALNTPRPHARACPLSCWPRPHLATNTMQASKGRRPGPDRARHVHAGRREPHARPARPRPHARLRRGHGPIEHGLPAHKCSAFGAGRTAAAGPRCRDTCDGLGWFGISGDGGHAMAGITYTTGTGQRTNRYLPDTTRVGVGWVPA